MSEQEHIISNQAARARGGLGIGDLGAGGERIRGMFIKTVNVNILSIAADDSNRTAVTVTGVAVGDAVLVIPPAALEAGLLVGVPFVSAANTVQLQVSNTTAGAVDPAAADYTFIILRKE